MHLDFMVTAVLRVTALLVLGLMSIRCLPADQPQWRRATALFCVAASLVLPFLSAPTGAVTFAMSVSCSPVVGEPTSMLGSALAACWAAGALIAATRLFHCACALRRWISECAVLEVSPFRLTLPVLVSRRYFAPCVAGFFKPVLIVPEAARDWSAETWRCVLAHELQHCRQGDLILGWLTRVAHVLYWWHPLMGLLDRELGQECESCCDQAVLRQGVRAGDYARELLRFTANGSAIFPATLAMSGKRASSVRIRLERILADQAEVKGRWHVFLVVVLILLGVAGTTWLGFAKPTSTSAQIAEAKLRLSANPFPADSP